MFTSRRDHVNQASGSCSAAMASFPVFSACSFMAFWTFGSLILGSKPSFSNLVHCYLSENSILYKSGQVAVSASRHLGCLTLSCAKVSLEKIPICDQHFAKLDLSNKTTCSHCTSAQGSSVGSNHSYNPKPFSGRTNTIGP